MWVAFDIFIYSQYLKPPNVEDLCEKVEICAKVEVVSVAHIEYLWIIAHNLELWRFVGPFVTHLVERIFDIKCNDYSQPNGGHGSSLICIIENQ